ncbi:redoxin domain-containing protein [Haloarcula pellucida]|uniref:Peroxiredoxin n=1 Tax=Haloarcula pellucida TaxID=1427151 RepID=A0A830GHJ6_9EURY|nr:redoxin domain-containing protein [Halomicroarcula pellucida]MBX0347230.1 redoxin domain-containing protein [Halomicroarcula pellucida]GGN87626.1 peroxiredoxin [Halomicroarcula pellucida]
MLTVGDEAPDFTAPLANGGIGELSLSDAVADGPVVLAFFPGAFTSVCGDELEAFDERRDELVDASATVYGVSIDTPFAQNAFRDQLGLGFALVSDNERAIIDAYDVSMDFEGLGVYDLAKRSVFVVDDGRRITYAWATDDPGVEPNYDDVLDAVRAT